MCVIGGSGVVKVLWFSIWAFLLTFYESNNVCTRHCGIVADHAGNYKLSSFIQSRNSYSTFKQLNKHCKWYNSSVFFEKHKYGGMKLIFVQSGVFLKKKRSCKMATVIWHPEKKTAQDLGLIFRKKHFHLGWMVQKCRAKQEIFHSMMDFYRCRRGFDHKSVGRLQKQAKRKFLEVA